MSDLRVYLLGTPRIEFAGEPIHIERKKALSLLAYLAVEDQQQSREVMAAVLWPNLDNGRARAALRSTLPALTRAVPVKWFDIDREKLGLRGDVVWIDVREFLALLARSRSHNHGQELICSVCVELLDQAVDLYRGEFLAGFGIPNNADFEHWQLLQRAWLNRELADVLRRLSNYYAQAERYEPAIRTTNKWLLLDPLHEPATRQLMRLYAATGRRSEALRQYQQCVELLDAELASPPEEETVRLFEAIQQNRESIPPNAGGVSPPGSTGIVGSMPPLPSRVVGREQTLRELKRRLGIGGEETRNTTVIQGWPGVGKSTTVALLAHDLDVARQFPDGVLWTSLGEQPNLLGQISAWADAFRLSEPGRTRKIDEISAQLTAVLRDKRVLLIVDDVWHVEDARPFRVGGQKCSLIFTSRLNDVAMALTSSVFDLYRLSLLTDAAAFELLDRLAPEITLENPDEARELVRDLEGLPLAIHVAGRLLHSEARMGWGIRELLEELRTGAALLQAEIPSDMSGSSGATPGTVTALLKRSTDLLDSETRRRFAYLGLFVPKPATFDLRAMSVAWDVPDARVTVRLLVNRGLLEPVNRGRFQMHALLVMHARSLLAEVA